MCPLVVTCSVDHRHELKLTDPLQIVMVALNCHERSSGSAAYFQFVQQCLA